MNFIPWSCLPTQIARFMGPKWGPSGADRTQVGPINLAIWVNTPSKFGNTAQDLVVPPKFFVWPRHDDVIEWKYFSRYWPGDRWPEDPPHKGQLRWALMLSLICAWTNDWANNRDAGELKRDCVHYDVTVMESHCTYSMLRTSPRPVQVYSI